MNRGATAVKLFPASIGGPGYLKALRDPFPGIPFIAVGGVGLDEAAGYWNAGAVAVGLGGPLFGDAGSGGDLAPMRERARAFVALAAEFEPPDRRGAPAVTAPIAVLPVPGMPELLTFGESMVSLRSTGPLSAGGSLGMHVAGAESNVAVGRRAARPPRRLGRGGRRRPARRVHPAAAARARASGCSTGWTPAAAPA